MVRLAFLVLLIGVALVASLGLVGVVLIARPLLWILLGVTAFCCIVGLVLWGVNGGPQPMD